MVVDWYAGPARLTAMGNKKEIERWVRSHRRGLRVLSRDGNSEYLLARSILSIADVHISIQTVPSGVRLSSDNMAWLADRLSLDVRMVEAWEQRIVGTSALGDRWAGWASAVGSCVEHPSFTRTLGLRLRLDLYDKKLGMEDEFIEAMAEWSGVGAAPIRAAVDWWEERCVTVESR